MRSSTTVFESSRYDLAGTSIDAFRSRLFTDINTSSSYPWFRYLMGFDDIIAVNPTGTAVTGGRFQASPFSTSPITAQQVASQSPIFLPACTQFIVEYAGDYFSQEQEYSPPGSTTVDANYGQIIDSYDVGGTDGQIDFIVDRATKKRQIRWYGLPRDTNGPEVGVPDGHVIGWSGATSTLTPNQLIDVVPLRDVYRSAAKSPVVSTALTNKLTALGPNAGESFERFVPLPDRRLHKRYEYRRFPICLRLRLEPHGTQAQDDSHHLHPGRSQRKTPRGPDVRICVQPSLRRQK